MASFVKAHAIIRTFVVVLNITILDTKSEVLCVKTGLCYSELWQPKLCWAAYLFSSMHTGGGLAQRYRIGLDNPSYCTPSQLVLGWATVDGWVNHPGK